MQGPKLRVGRFQAGRVALQTGQPFRLDLSPVPGDTRRVQLPHPEIMAAAGIGTTLLLDDGKLRLRVVRKRDDHLECEIVTGGPLSDRKGVNVPDVVLPIPALTKKDHEDLQFALAHGVDYIGLSFVQRPEDVAEAQAIADGRAWIMTKLEKPQALDNLDGILALSDAVMVARGDLGVELPPEEVPLAQKRIVRAARQLGIPVVVATQMLESMITAPAPTRAEASGRRHRGVRRRGRGDAVGGDGGRAVPVRGGQHDGPHRRAGGAGPGLAGDHRGGAPAAGTPPPTRSPPPPARSRTRSAPARSPPSPAPAAPRCASRATRPECPVLGLTTTEQTARRLAVVWGVHAVVAAETHSMTDTVTGRRGWPDRGLRRPWRRGRGGGGRAVRPGRHDQRAAGGDGEVAGAAGPVLCGASRAGRVQPQSPAHLGWRDGRTT